MRRAALVIAVAWSTAAHAGPWSVTAETGAEADSNVERVETGPGLGTMPIASPALRLGGRLEHRAELLGGAYALAFAGLERVVGGGDVSAENVALVSADARWLRPVGSRPVSIGVAVTAADVIALAGGIGARAFSNLGADVLFVVSGGDDRRLTLAVGGRDFHYKPDPEFDWSGPTASARLDLVLWQPSGKTRSLELTTLLGFEARTYASTALANACASDAPTDPTCFAPTSAIRRDRFQRAGVELTYSGRFVGAIGYQLTVVDSNSFGQSLTRHRATATATLPLPLGLFATALATLQIDRFADGLIVQTDLQHTEFTSLDDENRSSLQLRLARPISGTWSIEARGAIWRDLGSNTNSEFHRSLIYAGAIYSR